MNEYGGTLKDKLVTIKKSIQERYYYFMIGIIISTIIIIIINVIRKISNRLSKIPQNEDCTSFKNTTLNILLTIAVIMNFYFIIPKEIYKYNLYQNKLKEINKK